MCDGGTQGPYHVLNRLGLETVRCTVGNEDSLALHDDAEFNETVFAQSAARVNEVNDEVGQAH